MQRFASVVRALALASVVPVVVLAARTMLDAGALSPADALSLDAAATAASLALLALAAASLGREPIAPRLGLGPARLPAARVVVAAAGLVGLSHAAEALLQLCGASSPNLARFDAALHGIGLSQIGVPFLALAIGSAFGEELFFRGLLQRGLVPVLGPGPAIGAVALAFGALHGDLAHGSAAAGLGLYLGALAFRADSTRASFAAHALNNAVALVETATELRIPEGPLATPLSLAAGLTLACVGLAAMRPPAPSILQSPAGSAD